VSVHVAILKVLSTYSDGCAALAALNADLAILSGSEDWTSRMRSYAARVPGLDIFSQRLVVRERHGWQITDAGRLMLDRLEGRNPDATEPSSTIGAPSSRSDAECALAMESLAELSAGAVRPQLMLIQGGKTHRRGGAGPAGSHPVAKGAAARP
jgi:hypothetical protein